MSVDLIGWLSRIIPAAAVLPLAALIIYRLARHRLDRRQAVAAVAVVALMTYPVLEAAVDTPLDMVWFIVFPVIAMTYPDGRVVPRWFMAVVATSAVLVTANVVLGGGLSSQQWWGVFASGQVVLGIGASIYRYRFRSTTSGRESLRWALLGVIVTVEWFAVQMVIEGGTIAESGPWSVAAAEFGAVWYLVGLGVGLVRPRLLNVDRVLWVVIGFAIAGPILGGAYAGAVAVSRSALTPDRAGWVGACVSVAAAVPVIRLAARWSAWVVYRGRADPGTAIKRLGAAVAVEPEATQVPVVVLEVVRSALFLEGAEFCGPVVLAARVGSVSEPAERFPVDYLGVHLADLVIGPRAGESELTSRDREVARALMLHAAPALHDAQMLGELTDAHTRLLLAREEERRRLRRDLHDDLSPSLAGLGMSASAISRRARATDPDLATTAEDLQRDIAAVVAQVRELAHDLRPAILDEHGLVAAIRARVNGQQADTIEVRVDGPSERMDLPAAVDLAALRIVQEAVSNVRRHSAARLCTVDLRLVDDRLRVTIADDGVGLPASIRPGIGVVSIRDRARELGGTAVFDRGPGGGGRVRVDLPLQWNEGA